MATQLVTSRLGGGLLPGSAPAWAVANAQACTDWGLGNPNGDQTPGAPPGAIQPAWNGAATAGTIGTGVARIALGLITADPGAQVRYLRYYRWNVDDNLPANCVQAAHQATEALNGWIRLGAVVAQLMWMIGGGNPTGSRPAATGCGTTAPSSSKCD